MTPSPAPRVIAHRGASHAVAEHTLGAYLAALDEGAQGLECDVRLTADGHLVCVHDRDLRRVAGHRALISTMELADLAELDVSTWKNPWADLDDEAPQRVVESGRVLTLRALLETVAGLDRRVEVAVETKHPTRYGGLVEKRVAELLRDFGWDREDSPVRVMSFSNTALHRVARLAPEVPIVQLLDKAHHWPMVRRMVPPHWVVGPDVHELRDHPGLGRRLVDAGRTIHSWVVNTAEDVAVCRTYGVSALITDRPGYVRGLVDAGADGATGPTGVSGPPSSLAGMGKRSRDRARNARAATQQQEQHDGAVGPRQPCPCGSGKRYKACHGQSGSTPFVVRPFEGMPSEADVVALRELVPAATAPLPLRDSDREVRLVTLLPGAAPAMVRESGAVWLALQVRHDFGDPARDLGAVLERALEAEPGTTVGLTTDPGPGTRLQDLVAPGELEVTVHDGFGFWVDDLEETGPEVEAALEQANGVVSPTARLASVPSAYWTDVTTKEHLRWVRPEPEDRLLDALARLHVQGRDVLVEGARLVGHFRAHGLVVPVWDLPVGTGPEAVEDPAAELGEALEAALADDSPLSSEERSARAGITGRQVTIR